jgi:hypothetical protein
MLLHDYQPLLPPLLTELAKHSNASDLLEVQEILAEIQSRIRRFKQ